MPRLYFGEFCLSCHPELIKAIYKKKNLAILKALAFYYLCTYLLISTIGFWFFKPIIISYLDKNNLSFIKSIVSGFIFIGIEYFFILLIAFLLPMIIRFIIYKKPMSYVNAHLVSAINLILLTGISLFMSENPGTIGCLFTYFISVIILDYGYDKRLQEIDSQVGCALRTE
jgi:hypothetical protein